jgi:hypothetical protein
MADFLGQATGTDLQRINQQAGSAQTARDRLEKAKLTWRDRFFQDYGHHYDRGHFISHRQGGGLDINLFPQLADINRGRTPLGAEYRAMEKACVARPGVDPVFCCSRPIYNDDSWVPTALEYAVIYSVQRIDVRTFPNRPNRGRSGGAGTNAGDAEEYMTQRELKAARAGRMKARLKKHQEEARAAPEPMGSEFANESAQANTLIRAAKTGTPFCELCGR